MILSDTPLTGYMYHVSLFMILSIIFGIQGYLVATLTQSGIIPTTEGAILQYAIVLMWVAVVVTAIAPSVKNAIRENTGETA